MLTAAARTATAVLVVAMAAAGCTATAPQQPPATSQSASPDALQPPPNPDGQWTVAVTLAPLADLAGRVAGDDMDVITVLPAGVDSHTYNPTPQDAAQVAQADALIDAGFNLNPQVMETLTAQLPTDSWILQLNEATIPAAEAIHTDMAQIDPYNQPNAAAAVPLQPGQVAATGSHPHQQQLLLAHEGGGQPHAAGNPHTWTNPPYALRFVDVMAAMFADMDPDNAAAYQQRAQDLSQQLEALDEATRQAVATIPQDNRRLVMYHDAWQYFAREYGFEVVGVFQPSSFAQPSAKDVTTTIDQINTADVPAFFGSEVFPTDVLQTLEDETGTTYVGDLSDDALPGEPGTPQHSYVGLMSNNITLIVEALGGDATAVRQVAP